MFKKLFTIRGIQIILGVFWLIDGCLQLQHQMFSSNFANQVVFPSSLGQPVVIAGPIHLAVRIILMHPAVFDSIFAVIQFLIAITIFNKRTVKIGLIGSIVWGLAVWVGGEGMAGILSGHASLLMGAPGAALIYSIISLAVFPKSKETVKPAFWLVFIWLGIWIGGAIYQLLPTQGSIAYLKDMISSMAIGAPRWLTIVDNHVLSFLKLISSQPVHLHAYTTQTIYMMGMKMKATQFYPSSSSGYWFVLLLSLIELFIGVGVLFKGKVRKIAIILGIILSLIFWIIGQNLGNYYTGLATDPNTGPILILLGLIVVSLKSIDQELYGLYKKIETIILGK